MARIQDIGVCEHCKRQFGYHLIHNGFNDSVYAYCDTCGLTALLSLLYGREIPQEIPKGTHLPPYQSITSDIEPYLASCSCGGSFKANASPRCPHCLQTLSALHATDYIEAQAEGAKKGWRWQRGWTGLYCIIIEDKVVHDIWRQPNT